eukprot:m.141571 g.141571  ORF g.141571 m.141571 type:complete len:1080 (+) comp15983_c0_seq1:70-3309(+)
MEWTAIVVTSSAPGTCGAFLAELEKRREAGVIRKSTVLVAADDPKFKIGSGGATINALLMVTEMLSAQSGFTVVNADTIADAKILVLHLGGPFLCDPCGKAFTAFAAKTDGSCHLLACNVDQLLHSMSRLQQGGPAGVWICSTEMLLSLPPTTPISWDKKQKGMLCIAVPGTMQDAQQHGVYHLDEDQRILNLIYRGSNEAISTTSLPCGRVPLVAGVVWMCPETAEQLLALHTLPPLDASTYVGLDSGAEPLAVSLFLDVIAAMLPGSGPSFIDDCSNSLVRRARQRLVRQLANVPVHAAVLDGASFIYMPEMLGAHGRALYRANPHFEDKTSGFTWSHLTHTHGARKWERANVTIINTLVDQDVDVSDEATIVHSHLSEGWRIGSGCYVFGVDNSAPGVQLCSDMALLQIHLREAHASSVWVLLGTKDDINDIKSFNQASMLSFCNKPLERFLAATGISKADLWPDTETACSLRTARLFPIARLGAEIAVTDVLWMQDPALYSDVPERVAKWKRSWRISIADVLANVDVVAEFEWRDALYLEVASRNIQHALLNPTPPRLENLKGLPGQPSPYFLPFFRFSVLKGNYSILEKLDHVAASVPSPGVAARTLACIADMLAAMSQGRGGLRSGPGRNVEFVPALEALDAQQRELGVFLLARAREQWMATPDALVRAARHYEAAAQILIRQAVMTAFEFVQTSPIARPEIGQWVVARCPSRIDISGGWTDTPPVTYEHGGAVVNAAITIGGEKPIVVKCCRTPELRIRFVLEDSSTPQIIEITELSEVANYAQPQASGALLKAALCCAGVVDVTSSSSLQEQLRQTLDGGLEVHSQVNLPTGSGLGTSSILAGTVMAAVYRTCGFDVDRSSLNHATLYLEQLMTTGGGWQDQVGGICGGVKMTTSPPELPLRIDTKTLDLSSSFVQTFAAHFLLVFTGKTRLAKNLLQEVVRNWYARSSAIVENTNRLVETAHDCAQAFEQENLEKIGACLNAYRHQKRVMAPSCEPAHVRRMMEVFEPHAYGQALAGAGGGGFMYVITKQPNMKEAFEALIQKHFPESSVRCYNIALDEEGLVVDVMPLQ